jgi:hypothetical protein
MPVKKSIYSQWWSGETCEFKTGESNELKLACCSCGLIHRIVYHTVKGSNKVKVTLSEDRKATAAYRKHHKDELECTQRGKK